MADCCSVKFSSAVGLSGASVTFGGVVCLRFVQGRMVGLCLMIGKGRC